MLTWLANNMDVLVPVYCLDAREFEAQALGFPRMGPLRARFTIECLEDLRIGLEARGSGLYVVLGQPEKEIPRLAQTLDVGAVFAEGEILGEAAQVERRVATALEQLGVPLRRYWVATLTHPNELPFPMPNLPESFSQFREAVLAGGEPRSPLPPLQRLPTFPAGLKTQTLAMLVQALGRSAALEAGEQLGCKGGATVALAALEDFVQGRRASLDTLRTRTGGPMATPANQFAPWLGRGAISPRRIYQYVKYSGLTAWAGELAAEVIDELLRRDYCHFLALKHADQIKNTDPISGLNYTAARERFQGWQRGETGEPFVDAHLRELAGTGYLTGCGQRLVASYLHHQLRLEWRWGSAWFASRLLDDDPSVNLANWMEVIGQWRVSEQSIPIDPVEQAARYDRDGAYTRRWLGVKAVAAGVSR
jgi:deoxyribodipyrimidine photo-lyase